MSSTSRTPVLRGLAQHQAEERTIVRAAYRLIGQTDSGPLSVQDILTETGLSTRAFYRHFASKDDLIITMYRSDSQRTMARLSEAVALADSPWAAVEAWIDHWMATIYDRKTARHLRVLWSAETRDVAGFRNVEAEGNLSSITVLVNALARGRHGGDFPLVEPEDDARVFQAVVVSLLEARLFRKHPPTQAAARAHLTSFMARTLGCPLGDT